MPLIEPLKLIPDPRGNRSQRHPLWLVLFVALLGSLAFNVWAIMHAPEWAEKLWSMLWA